MNDEAEIGAPASVATADRAHTELAIAIVESASASTAKTSSNLMPIAVAAITMGWTAMYGRRQRARGERDAMDARRPASLPDGPETPLATAEP